MQTEHFAVLNVKCDGCAANIKNGLAELGGISGVEASIDSGEVTVEGKDLGRKQLAEKLPELGHPEA